MDKGDRIGTTGYPDQNGVSGLQHVMGAQRLVNGSEYFFFNIGIIKIGVWV
jgi:hypothetical protein